MQHHPTTPKGKQKRQNKYKNAWKLCRLSQHSQPWKRRVTQTPESALVPVTENVDGTQNAVFYSTLCDVATSDSIAWERAEKWEWTRRKWGRKTTVDLYRASSLKSKFVKLFGPESMGSLEFHQRGKIPIPEKCRDWRCWWSKSSCCVVLQHHVVLANSFAA